MERSCAALAVVACPTPEGIAEVVARRTGGSGEKLPDVVEQALVALSVTPPGVSIEVRGRCASAELATALAVLLLDDAYDGLRRGGWIVWGELQPDGSVRPAEGLANDLPPGPYAGQIWHPEDRLPAIQDDAVITAGRVSTLREAVEALEFFATVEDRVSRSEQIELRRAPVPLSR